MPEGGYAKAEKEKSRGEVSRAGGLVRMPKRLLTMNQVLERVPVSRQQIYAWISKGSFPRQIRLSENRVAWLEEDIEKWIESKIETTAE